MSDSHRIDRKEFLKWTLALVGTSATGMLSSCVPAETEEVLPGAGANGGTGPAGASGVAGSGDVGGQGGAGTGGTTAGAGAGGSAAGASGAAGTGGAGAGGAGAGGAGTSGNAGVASGGAGAGGAAASGGAGASSAGAGGLGAGGASAGEAGASGAATGGAAGAGGGTGSACTVATFVQNSDCMPMACQPHDHVPTNEAERTQFMQDLLAHINGPNALMPFGLPSEGPRPHSHDIIFTQSEIDTLRAGGMLTAKTIEPDTTNEVHFYTIGCS